MHRDKVAVFSVWYIFGSFLWEQLNEEYFHDLKIRIGHAPEDMWLHDVLSQKRMGTSASLFGFAILVATDGRCQYLSGDNVIRRDPCRIACLELQDSGNSLRRIQFFRRGQLPGTTFFVGSIPDSFL